MAFTEDNLGAKQPEFGAHGAELGKRWHLRGWDGRNGAETIEGIRPSTRSLQRKPSLHVYLAWLLWEAQLTAIRNTLIARVIS